MPQQFLYIFGGAIGDSLLGVHLGRTLAAANPGARLLMVSTRKSTFVRELLEPLPFISYEEMPKNNFSSWVRLISLARVSHAVFYFVPFHHPIPLWWRVIARCATLRASSVEVGCRATETKVPAHMRVVQYDSRTDSLFSVVVDALRASGVKEAHTSHPQLPVPDNCAPVAKTFILFHFFAASYRRSLPVDHARDLLKAARVLFPDDEFVVTCAHGEQGRAKRMADGISNVRIETGVSAHTLICLLTSARMVVGVSSGITHIASQLPARTVMLCNLSDPCWLPTYNPDVSLLYERARCGCNGDKTGVCEQVTEEGLVFRCLYDITTKSIIEAMEYQSSRQPKTA